jgi:Family of unknown function (DUF6491)
MTRYLLTGAFLTGALLSTDMAAIAQPPPPQPPLPAEKACLRPAQIYDYHPVPGNRAIVITDLARKRYRLTFMATCRELQYHIALRFKTFGVGGLSCVGRGDQIQMNDPVNPNPCIVQSIDYQTPALDQTDAAAAAAAKQH